MRSCRDEVGNPLSIEREDGYTVYYDYDAKHQLTGEQHLDGGEVYAWEWDYDAAGNREYQVFNGEATYYEYNAANELLTETTGGETTYYDYDGCGNTTVKQEGPRSSPPMIELLASWSLRGTAVSWTVASSRFACLLGGRTV